MTQKSNEDLEVYLLLTAIEKLYGIDYRTYRKSYIRRRIEHRMSLLGLETITALTEKILHSQEVAIALLKDISINVTDMFRCPEFFKALKDDIFPILQTYPSINIWLAGCSTGEEVISLAILLKEANLYKKTEILATDLNESVLEIAEKAIYPASRVKLWTENYNHAGGEFSFSTYYNVKYNQVKFNSDLQDRVTYKQHNLLKDPYYKDMHLILCRNVLIYFDEQSQEQVIYKFRSSLVRNCYLGLGFKESIKRFNKKDFTAINNKYKIYQRKERDDNE